MIGVLIMNSSPRDLTWLGATLTGGGEALDLSRGATGDLTGVPLPLLLSSPFSYSYSCCSICPSPHLSPFYIDSASFLSCCFTSPFSSSTFLLILLLIRFLFIFLVVDMFSFCIPSPSPFLLGLYPPPPSPHLPLSLPTTRSRPLFGPYTPRRGRGLSSLWVAWSPGNVDLEGK